MYNLQCGKILQRPRNLLLDLLCGYLFNSRCEYLYKLCRRIVFSHRLELLLYLPCGDLLRCKQWILFQVCSWEVLIGRCPQLQQLSSGFVLQ